MADEELPTLIPDREGDSPRDEGEQLDEDNRLKPEFVNAVRAAIADRDEGRAYELIEPLHPADIADLLELLEASERLTLAAAITDLMTAEVITELNDYVRDDMIEALPARSWPASPSSSTPTTQSS